MGNRIDRRTFLKRTAAAGLAAPLIISGRAWAQSPNSKLQHASIGVGGMMGGSDLDSIINSGNAEIVAICDIDENFLNKAAEKVPNARKYRDWREMLAKEGDKIDSVNVTVPDHMHAPIAMSALLAGKHVYCQKPLAHNIDEVRRLTETARKQKVVTQMGIQIHSHIAYRMGAQMLCEGAIGKIKEWHSWTSAPATPETHGRFAPQGKDPIPLNVDWDLWLGVAPYRPYKKDIYHPINWRGWKDFGDGALGDFACHIFDPIFMGIDVKEPISVMASKVSGVYEDSWPEWEIIEFTFPGNDLTAGKTIKATWYDGGKQPSRDLVPMPEDRDLPGSGSLIVGEEGVMVLPHWAGPQLYPEKKFQSYERPKLEHIDHYAQFVNACLGNGEADANFDYSGPLSETALLGLIASRYPEKELEWDAKAMRFTNMEAPNQYIREKFRKGWEIKGLM